jgi:imidazolonepropionase-like amidohydrolase
MTTTITNAAVFDGSELLEGRYDVQLDAGTVTALEPAGSFPATGELIDGSEATLLPGLIDGHVHFFQSGDFAALLSGGVTSAADMGTWPAEHLAELKVQSGGFEFRSAGAPLIGPSGPHSHLPGLAEAVIDSPEAAQREVAKRVAQGVDYIKLVLEAEGRGGPSPEAARAAVDAAHAAGLRAVAHASAVGAIELAVEIGVDIITHAPLDGVLRGEFITRIVQNGVVVVPTLIMMRTVAERRAIPHAYEFAEAFVTAIHQAGAVIVLGTDANSAPGSPAAVAHNTGPINELALLVDAGLSPLEALRSATSVAAKLYSWPERGAIREGAVADVLLVAGDPTTNISAIRDVLGVWLAGERVVTAN